MTTDDERRARIVLACVTEPGRADVHRAVAAYGPVEALDRLRRRTGVIRERLDEEAPAALAERRESEADRLGCRMIVPGDDEWPDRLGDLARISRPGPPAVDRDVFPPLCLWVRGWRPLAGLTARSVAVVGARAASAYGTHVAGELAYGLAKRGYAVVSGAAFGIDAAAHRGALQAGGPTVAVLACGLDRVYPLAHAGLVESIAEEGLVVSEWPPGSEPLRYRFLIRNRVIAALTLGTVMVEAAARSGSRQTLHRALRLGRAAMAVPGPVTSATSVGCHDELRNPLVQAVATVEHVVEEVGRIGVDLAPPVLGPQRPSDFLDDTDARLMDAVPRRRAARAADIAATAGVPLREALAKLPSLVTRGLLEEADEGYRLPA
ncbi:DNA-processing protein DprA [Hamadaea tsunoensis]|uniref:DNA-processing protein DprA n=1 Tax=Hamadaea tsunoensis TaxID=53368 RepID=UPI00041CA8AD|nr:DNA-processing protein DprA [Hamadaea tsunoensis]